MYIYSESDINLTLTKKCLSIVVNPIIEENNPEEVINVVNKQETIQNNKMCRYRRPCNPH